MTTQIQQALSEVNAALVQLIGKYKELEAIVNATSAPYNQQSNTMMPAAMQQVAAPMDTSAPQIKVRVVLWEKPSSLSGVLSFHDMSSGQQIAEMRIVLFVSNPNDRNLALNGYVLPKDQQQQPGGKISDGSIGSVFVTKNGGLHAEVNLTATPVYNQLKVQMTLNPNPARTSANQPILEGEFIMAHHFFTEATRAQLQAAGHQQQPQQPAPQQQFADLLSSPGQPSDFGVLTGGLQQPTQADPSLASVMSYLQ